MNRSRAVLLAVLVSATALVGSLGSPAQAVTQPSDWCRTSLSPVPVGASTTGAAYAVGTASGVAVSPAGTPVTPNGGPYVGVEVYDGSSVVTVWICVSSNAWNDYSHPQSVGGWYQLVVDSNSKEVRFHCTPNPKAAVQLPCYNRAVVSDPRPATPGGTVSGSVSANGSWTTVGATGAEAGSVTVPFDPMALTTLTVPYATLLVSWSAGVTKPCVFVAGTQPAGPCGTSNLARVDGTTYDAATIGGSRNVCLGFPGGSCIANQSVPQIWTGIDPTRPAVRLTLLDFSVPVDPPRTCVTFC